MPAKLSATATAVWRIDNSDLPSQCLPENGARRHQLPAQLGLGHSTVFSLERDLSYIETRYAPSHDLAVLSRIDNEEPRMVVTLGLQGCSRFTTHQGDGIDFKEGYTAITTFNASEGTRQYRGNQAVTQLRFALGKSWLERYFGENRLATLFSGSAMQVISDRPMSTSGLIAAQALLCCNVAGNVRPLFRQGQAMAILASELSHLLADTATEAGGCNPRDRERADLARQILYAEFKNPPSVEELARRVGTNQFKLKQLFHRCFDNTPYGLLLEIRMKCAYQLLSTSHCSIAIAAETVGYNHASNFSAAFSKYFGFSPKQLVKQH